MNVPRVNFDKAFGRARSVLEELYQEHPGWEQTQPLDFFVPIVLAGFNSATIKQAFVLAQIVEELGPITVRGAFYRAVSAGVFPDTGDQHYRATCNIVLKLRRKWCVKYSSIVDSHRVRHKESSWSGVGDFLETCQQAYRRDLWERQAECVEIFVEKDAMSGIIQPVSDAYDIALNVIRGQVSESFAWSVSEIWKSSEKPIAAYYLGDHDPAGLEIESKLRDKMAGFYGADFKWSRIAVDAVDFHRSDLLGFPIKGDRNSKRWKTYHRDYLERFGDRCVEVDAIHPEEIRGRVRLAIESHIDQNEWRRLQAVETAERQSFQQFVLAQKLGGAAA